MLPRLVKGDQKGRHGITSYSVRGSYILEDSLFDTRYPQLHGPRSVPHIDFRISGCAGAQPGKEPSLEEVSE